MIILGERRHPKEYNNAAVFCSGFTCNFLRTRGGCGEPLDNPLGPEQTAKLKSVDVAFSKLK
jgi:hypothetical protein